MSGADQFTVRKELVATLKRKAERLGMKLDQECLAQMERLLDRMKVQMEAMIGQINEQFATQQGLPEGAAEDIEAFQQELFAEAMKIMDFENTKEEFVKMFVEVYTVEELEAIVAFYKTPAGKSMVEKQPLIMQKGFEISQSKLKVLIPEMQRLVEEFAAKMDAKYGK